MTFIDLPDRIPGVRAQARQPQSWYRITNQSADEAEVMLYDEVGGWLGATADEFINDLRGITASNILLRVNSPGGQVYEGIAIANALRSHPASVTVQVDGIAASIASVIAMAGDRVRMMPNAMIMVHDASGLTVGNAADHRDTADLLDKISGNIADAYAARAGGTRDEWRQVMVAETWYTAEEAVAAGLADEVVPTPKRGDGEPEMRQQFDLAAYGYTGPRAEQPKAEEPLDVTEHVAGAPTLLITMGDLLSDETVAKLRALFTKTTTPEPVAETTPAEPAPELATAPVPEAPAAEPVDEWAASVAGLLPDDDADDWSALVTNMTGPDTSSRAAAEA
ncbi:Clp protease [Streptomyces sp. WAC02707]|uniref:head maturation protease, ClpP-related n=1 Tax=Streptomyces sp. WAC02707 TaxID=2487417 RepID=UPI000F797E08|nr:head maturation protease, ClpP-related [Streptomyces sp. WAC02707]RSS92457.1 Clp protease [Streptomyces sp. WAC02707]